MALQVRTDREEGDRGMGMAAFPSSWCPNLFSDAFYCKHSASLLCACTLSSSALTVNILHFLHCHGCAAAACLPLGVLQFTALAAAGQDIVLHFPPALLVPCRKNRHVALTHLPHSVYSTCLKHS